MKTFLALACTAALVLGGGLASRSIAAEGLKVGDPAPDFELVGSDGKTHKLADYKGKQAVVIAWFPKAFTGGCTKECKSMRESGEAIKKYDVAYFTASCDDVETNKKFAESLGLDYPILSDPTHEAAKAFGVLGPKGNAMRWTFYIGKDGRIQAIDKDVATRLATSAEDMAAKLGELKTAPRK